jgi:hypothetical protein
LFFLWKVFPPSKGVYITSTKISRFIRFAHFARNDKPGCHSWLPNQDRRPTSAFSFVIRRVPSKLMSFPERHRDGVRRVRSTRRNLVLPDCSVDSSHGRRKVRAFRLRMTVGWDTVKDTGMVSGERPPECHSWQPSRCACLMSDPPECHSDERSEEESSLRHSVYPICSKISHFVRNDMTDPRSLPSHME